MRVAGHHFILFVRLRGTRNLATIFTDTNAGKGLMGPVKLMTLTNEPQKY
jgi:hypothetical protein